MKKLLLLSVAMVLVWTGMLPAHADDHWPKQWPGCGTNVFVRLNDNTNWSSAQINAVGGAVDEWNNERNSCDPVLKFDNGNVLVHWNGCNTGGNVNVERVGVGGIPGHPSADGWTDQGCGGTYLTVVHLYFVHNASAYWGASIPEPSGDYGERGLITHEFGHAEGFLGHWQDDHSSYCVQGPSGGGAGDWQTMCQGMYESSTGDWEQNRSYSLGTQDQASFNAAY